jgi:glycosyltransferase involved in cell wall biosynthesis
MKISVVLDNYNSELFIRDAIQSVLDQTRQPDELVVVDDGSADGSVAIAEEMLAEVSWAKVVTKTNGGQLCCITEGVRHATGDIVGLLDGDDLWREDHLEIAEKEFIKEPKLSLYSGAYQEFGERDKLWQPHYRGLLGQTFVLTMSGKSCIEGVNSALVAKRADLELLLDLPKNVIRDWFINADNIIIWLTSMGLGKKFGGTEPTMLYRVHANNNFKKLESHEPVAYRKVAIECFFECCKKQLSVPADIGKLLYHEFRAHPVKSPSLKKEYLKALKKSKRALGLIEFIKGYLRIHFSK